MTHYAQSDWTDLARNVKTNRQEAMQAHLAECRNCQKDNAFWREVHQAATAPRLQAPDLVVRSVKAVFGLHKPRPARVKYATLAFDSLLALAPQGLRAAAPVLP